MRRLGTLLGAIALAVGLLPTQAQALTSPLPKIAVIVLENTKRSDVVGKSAAPFMNALDRPGQGVHGLPRVLRVSPRLPGDGRRAADRLPADLEQPVPPVRHRGRQLGQPRGVDGRQLRGEPQAEPGPGLRRPALRPRARPGLPIQGEHDVQGQRPPAHVGCPAPVAAVVQLHRSQQLRERAHLPLRWRLPGVLRHEPWAPARMQPRRLSGSRTSSGVIDRRRSPSVSGVR